MGLLLAACTHLGGVTAGMHAHQSTSVKGAVSLNVQQGVAVAWHSLHGSCYCAVALERKIPGLMGHQRHLA